MSVEQKLNAHYNNRVTCRNAVNRVKKIAKDLNCNGVEDLLDIDPQLIVDHIQQKNESSRSINMHQIKTMFQLMDKPIPNKISKACDEFTKQKNKVYREQQKNKQLNDSIDIDKIYQYFHDQCFKPVARTFKKKDRKGEIKTVTQNIKPRFSMLKASRLVLFSILRDRCVRLSDLVDVTFTDTENNNYINMDENKLIIRNDKSSRLSGKKKYENREINLSSDTIENIKYFKDNCGSDYLFTNCKKTDSVTLDTLKNSFNTSMKFYCKQNNIEYIPQLCGIHELRRHEAKRDIDGIDIQQLLKIQEACKARGHTIQTMLNHYTRVN